MRGACVVKPRLLKRCYNPTPYPHRLTPSPTIGISSSPTLLSSVVAGGGGDGADAAAIAAASSFSICATARSNATRPSLIESGRGGDVCQFGEQTIDRV